MSNASTGQRSSPRPWLVGVIVGLLAFAASVAIMLAGSDHPPPPGFAIVVVACAGLGMLMGRLVPVIAAMKRRGQTMSALAVMAGSSAAYLMIVAALFVLLNPGTAGFEGMVIFIAVAGCAGAFGGLASGAVSLALLRLSRAT